MRRLWLGIDGGASKTRGVLVTADGRVAARARTGGSAILAKMPPRSRRALNDVVRALCRQAGIPRSAIVRAGVGLNGIDFDYEYPGQLRAVSAALGLPARKLVLVNDAIAALWASTTRPAAVLVQHGSGWTAAWRRRPGGERLFDHLASGSPFDIRFAVVPFVARQLDGREPVTGLTRRVLRHLGVSARGYAEAVFRGRLSWDRLKLIPPVVYRAWEAGDPAAATLVRQAAGDYAAAAVAMIRKTGSRRPFVGLGGGIINHAPDALRRMVARLVHETFPQAIVGRPVLPPEVGAAIMAAFADGLEPRAFFTGAARLGRSKPGA